MYIKPCMNPCIFLFAKMRIQKLVFISYDIQKDIHQFLSFYENWRAKDWNHWMLNIVWKGQEDENTFEYHKTPKLLFYLWDAFFVAENKQHITDVVFYCKYNRTFI